MKTNGDDTAYPIIFDTTKDNTVYSGLTKREYFAALAMQGCLSRGSLGTPKEFAETSVDIADALIAELNKRRMKDENTKELV